MDSNRASFLQRVRQAVAEGNRAGAIPPLPDRGAVGYQGAGPDPVARLRDEVIAAGGQFHLAAHNDEAVILIVHLLEARSARRVLLGGGPFIDELPLRSELESLGIAVHSASAQPAEHARTAFFSADVGITGVDSLVAETGTVVLSTRPDQPRAFSLLPPVHIAVAHRSQIVPDLFDLFETQAKESLPACLTLITGPSKTGDIELRLVTGVHGPGEVHVVLVTG
jgi:L-lactate dehydrogenase complex protein LldG